MPALSTLFRNISANSLRALMGQNTLPEGGRCLCDCNSCSVVNIFILSVREGGTSYSGSVVLCDLPDWCNCTKHFHLYHGSQLISSSVASAWFFPGAWWSLTVHCAHECVSPFACACTHAYGVASSSNPTTELIDSLSVDLDMREFESSGLPALCADDSTAAWKGQLPHISVHHLSLCLLMSWLQTPHWF